jgi:protoheme IX farnesyltransferase
MGLDIQTAVQTHERLTLRELLKMVVTLFKLRVVSLLLLAAIGGAFLGARGTPSFGALATVFITGLLSAGGASAINQYLERDSDTRMRRTHKRPLAAGQLRRPALILWIAIAMILAAVLSVLPTNPAMAFYLALGALVYVLIYTIWLKPRSVLNIVIGGAAGSCAVMTGGAAVGAASDPGVIVLALLLFLWTPAHFWALAMFYKEDYAAADVPMLPVYTNGQHTAWWIFIHTASTGLAAVLLAFHPALGWVYALPVGVITVMMMSRSIKLIRSPERKWAIKLFITTNIFLALVLLWIMLVTAGRQIILSIGS